MSADLWRLRAVLERELESGAADTLVQGGLDAMLAREAEGEREGSPVRRMRAALPIAGYAAMDTEERVTWLRRALATIRRETALADELAPPPIAPVPERPARASRAAAKPARASRPRAAPGSASGGEERGGAATPGLTGPQRAARRAAPGAAALDLPIEDAGTGLRAPTFARLEHLGIRTVGDALRAYPYRHHDFSRTVPISALKVGVEQTVRGTIDRAREVRMGRGGKMRATEAVLTDDLGARITATWFNQPYIARSLPAGSHVALAGKVTIYRGRPVFQNPEYERLDGPHAGAHTGRFVPVYSLTQGLPQRTLRTMIASLLEAFGDRIEDPVPEAIRRRHGLVGLAEATRQIHYPDSEDALREARRRLAFDELLAIQLGVVSRKREWQAQGNAPVITDHAAAEAFLATLPFALTRSQREALAAIRADIARNVPMSRLLEGDVGSGKTVVALAAMLSMISAGYQAVMMAPTEVLAEQHYRTLCRMLSGLDDGASEPPLHGVVNVPGLPLPVRIVLLTGSTRAAERRAAMEALKFGGAQLAVGTHALIQENVEYARLGLAVVDEQHRFGVMQRGALRRKGIEGGGAALREDRDRAGEASSPSREEHAISPHLLVMSATPIPRSLALTAYGDLDLTIIDELPPGRTPIVTKWLSPIQRREAFATMRAEIEAGRQAFVICPLVEGSETVESRAATEEFERLRTEEFPDLGERGRILLLHGRMGAKQKDGVMRAFANGEADILVSTAVVEVGIDVPNATVMAIEGADRFGLAQLHQFRGRVGRGDHASTCFLLADDPTPEAEERLSVMERTTDGFALAEADLQLRGPGDLFGTAQSGIPSLRVASLLDAPLIDAARREAETLLDEDPDLKRLDHQALKAAIASRTASVVAEMH
ncbi:MAG: ATP-dependent DNA helicase RecG [Dehalococcoidia bacterium]